MHPCPTPLPVGSLLSPYSALRVAPCPQDRSQVRTLKCRDTSISFGATRGVRDPQRHILAGIPVRGGIQRMLATRPESPSLL